MFFILRENDIKIILFIFNFLKSYFIYYAITGVQLSQFFPLCPSPPGIPHSLRQFPHHCSCAWVMHVSSLATPFPILYFTSPWLFCNYLFVLLNPLTFLPIPPHHPSPGNHQNPVLLNAGIMPLKTISSVSENINGLSFTTVLYRFF